MNDNDDLYAAGMRIARIFCSECSAPTTCHYHTDALESTRLVTYYNKGVNMAFSDNSQPYGQDNGTPTGSKTYKFTDKTWQFHGCGISNWNRRLQRASLVGPLG